VQYGSYPYKALLCQGTGKIRGFPWLLLIYFII
jgi:hypothetical protein